jgi:hypothetical protein
MRDLAFYGALEINDSAVKVLGDETPRGIARELVETVRRNVAIDWTERQSARVKIRAFVCRIPRKHGYPPDMARTSDADSVRASRASGSPGASHFENLWDTPVTAKLRSGGTSAASTSRSRTDGIQKRNETAID